MRPLVYESFTMMQPAYHTSGALSSTARQRVLKKVDQNAQQPLHIDVARSQAYYL